jgi:hypothetical protein
MEYGSVGQTYVLLQRAPDSLAMGKLGANLQFTVKEIDPSSGQPPLLACLADAPALMSVHIYVM